MAKIQDIINQIKEMKVVELNELVKAIEVEFGVTAAAPVAAAASTGAAESTEKKVILTSAGQNKVSIIKIVRDLLGLGLMEAKEFVDKAPATVKEGLSVEKATEIAKQFTDAGATVKVE